MRITGRRQGTHGEGAMKTAVKMPNIDRIAWWNTWNANTKNARKSRPSLVDTDGNLRPIGRAFVNNFSSDTPCSEIN